MSKKTRRSHLVQFRYAFGCPGSPREEDDPSAVTSKNRTLRCEVRTAVFVDDINDFVREFFPTFARVGTGFIGLHGQACIEKENSVLCPRSQVPFTDLSDSNRGHDANAANMYEPMLRKCELRVFILNFLIDLPVAPNRQVRSSL